MQARPAAPGDVEAIARIYNQGIEDRIATFETEPRTADSIRSWLDENRPVLAIEDSGRVVAFAACSRYSARECYSGVGEVSIYVAREDRGRGTGRFALEAFIGEAARRGYWKLIGRILAENAASRRLVASCGFREVGTHCRHARLDGVWRDVIIVERLLGPALEP